MDEWVWARIATALCFVPLLVYVTLFWFRKEVSLRPWTTATLMLLGAGVRLGLTLAGLPLGISAMILCGLVGLILVGQLLGSSTPLYVHATEASIRAEIDEACRRLFLQKEEPRPG